MWNIHRESRNTRNTNDSLGSGTKLLLPSSSLGFSTRGERDTQFFYADGSSIVSSQLTDPTNARAHPLDHNWTGLTQLQKSTRFVEVQISTHCFFFKITKNPCPSLPGMTSFTSPVLFTIRSFYYDICDCHILPACAWTPALMSAPTHALSRKVLSLTKLKDKIYKTKNNIKKILPQLYNTRFTLVQCENRVLIYGSYLWILFTDEIDMLDILTECKQMT